MAVQYDSKNNSWSTWLDTFKKDIPSASKEAVSAFEKIKKAQEAGYNIDNMDRWIHQNKLADETLISFLQDTKYGTKDLASYQQYLKESSQSMTLFQRATKAAGGVVKSLGATLGSMAAMWAIGEVISLVATGIDNAVHKVEYAQERLEDFNSSMKEIKDTLKSQQDWITENGETYSKLAKGVDDYGHNVSLTTDEFKQYNDITSKIAEMFPDMVQGYNDQNKAIIKNKGNVEALTKAYENARKTKYAKILTKSSDTYGDYKNAISDAKKQREEINSLIQKDQKMWLGENYGFSIAGNDGLAHDYRNIFDESLYEEITKYIKDNQSKFLSSSGELFFDFDQLSPQLQSKIRAVLTTANATISTETSRLFQVLCKIKKLI